MVVMHINFISSSYFNKCRNSLYIISELLEDLPMDQVQAMETMLKLTITNMEILSMGRAKTIKTTIKRQTRTLVDQVTNFCSNLKKSFTLHPQEKKRNRLFEVHWFLMENRLVLEVMVVNKWAILVPNRAMMEIEIKHEHWYDFYLKCSFYIYKNRKLEYFQ